MANFLIDEDIRLTRNVVLLMNAHNSLREYERIVYVLKKIRTTRIFIYGQL